GVVVAYDPSNPDPAQELVKIDAGTIRFPSLGLSGGIQNLHIRKDGFAFDQFFVEAASVRISSLLSATDLLVTRYDFGVPYRESVVFSGAITVSAASAQLQLGNLSASVTDGDGDGKGLNAVFQFHNGAFDSLLLSGDVTHFQIGSFV